MQVDVRGHDHVKGTGEGSRTMMFARRDQNMWRYLLAPQIVGSDPAQTIALIRETLDAPRA